MEYFKQISVLSFSLFHFLCLSSSSLLSLITSPNNFGKKILNSCRIYTHIMGWIYCPPNRAKLVSLKLYHTFINIFSYLDVILMVKATIRACKKFFFMFGCAVDTDFDFVLSFISFQFFFVLVSFANVMHYAREAWVMRVKFTRIKDFAAEGVWWWCHHIPIFFFFCGKMLKRSQLMLVWYFRA